MLRLLFVLLSTTIFFFSFAQTQLGQAINAANPSNGFAAGSSFSLSDDGKVLAVGFRAMDMVKTFAYNSIQNKWQLNSMEIEGAANSSFGNSVSISADGNYLAIGARKSSSNINFAGESAVYAFVNNQWVKKGSSIYGLNLMDYSGSCIAISKDGNTICIGEDGNDDNGNYAGQTRIFTYSTTINNWKQKGNDIEGEGEGDFSGRVVKMSQNGEIVAIGAYRNDGGGGSAGHVRVFKYDNQTKDWLKIGQDLDGEYAGDESGRSFDLSSDGMNIIIGAIGNSDKINNAGHARIFKYSNNLWSQIGNDIDGVLNEESGYSVSISDNGKIVGVGSAYYDGIGNRSGRTKFYKFNGSAWVKACNDVNGIGSNNESGSGLSMSSSGTIVAIGEAGYGSVGSKGRIRVFDLGICAETFAEISPSQSCFYTSPTGKKLTATGKYYDTLQNSAGCDSFITINLTITSIKISKQPSDTSVKEGKSAIFSINQIGQVAYQWQSNIGFGFQDLSDAGQYSGSKTNSLKVNQLTLSNNNQFFRCLISDGSCFDTSQVAILEVLEATGLETRESARLSIYPNPFSNEFSLIVPNTYIGKKAIIKLYNGTTYKEFQILEEHNRVDMAEVGAGIYILELDGIKYRIVKIN